MNYVLFDDIYRDRLLPFTHTRPVADIRCGMLTMRERWEKCFAAAAGSLTADYLQELFPVSVSEDIVFVNACVFGSHALANAVDQLQADEKLVSGDLTLAVRTTQAIADLTAFNGKISSFTPVAYNGDVYALKNVWDIFSLNDRALRDDFVLVTQGRNSAAIPGHVTVTGIENLFIEEGANVYPGCIINANAGPVYIGWNAEVLEGVLMRGPIAVCEQAVVKMGAKLYGATTIGPGCKAGGEINNAVFFANSNKSHDGYLGNAVIGEWCNLGADTNCSNLKNNYDQVKVWDEAANKSVATGLTFCGLMMGDHSKCGINTMFNTGTIVGVSCNIFGGGFPEKFVRSFSWGGSEGLTRYDFSRAMETAGRMMARRGVQLSDKEIAMYRYIYDRAGH